MMMIALRVATIHDMGWVNEKYQEIGFQLSHLENETIVVAEVGSEIAGLGRIVNIDDSSQELGGIHVFEKFQKQGVAGEIVRFLLTKRDYKKQIYCLPFEEVLKIYTRVGFQPVLDHSSVSKKVYDKYLWCLDTYPSKTLLLELT